MPNKDYWIERMASIEQKSHETGAAFTSHVERQFRRTEKNIQNQINMFYAKIAENNGISYNAAKELLRKDELEDFHMTVEEYIKKGEMLDFDDTYLQQLKNASAKVHIERLEALKLQMQQECEVLFGNMTDGLDKTLTDIYTKSYYNTAYEFMKGHGVGWAFNKIDTRKIRQAINTAWAYDGKTFTARCWTNKNKLVNELQNTLTQSLIRGESPQKAIDLVSKRMQVSRYSAGRLIMTESCAISTMSQQKCYKELGVEKFEFVATLDSSTSDICRGMDGKVFDMADYKIGVNVPPLHCFCRSCTVPYYEDIFGSVGERVARGDNGKLYNVPANITYDEWEKTFVVDKDLSKEMFELKGKMADMTFKKYENIWKDPVTVENYKTKSGSVEAKKDYFESKLVSATGADKEKFEKLLANLNEFEEKGKLYEQYRKRANEIQKELKRKANGGRIEIDRYSQDRKDEALWTDKVKEADAELREVCGEVWKKSTQREKEAIYDYTCGSGGFNRPLSGYEKPWSLGGSGWERKYFKGSGNVWIDFEAKGDKIRAMTDMISRSTYDFDMWLQRGCNNNAIESFLGLKEGTLSSMTEAELQKYVGVSNQINSFVSCGVAKGKGFDTKPVIMNIYAPSGTNMMYAEPFSSFGNGGKLGWDGLSAQSSFGSEAEMIIQRGSSFTITKIEKKGYNIYIDVEVHPEDGYNLFQQAGDWTGSTKNFHD